MSTELTPLNQDQETKLVEAIDTCHLAAEMKNTTIKTLKLAYGQQQLNQVLNLPEVAAMIMSFQNSALGFLTDRKEHGYTQEIVIKAAQEALTAGAYIHGNEFNIIAERCYLAQSFFIRKVREFCSKNLVKRNFTYECKFVEPCKKQSKFRVRVKIKWTFPGKEETVQEEAYNLVGVSEDQVNGKAEKRAHQWLYNELTDNSYPMAPDEPITFNHEGETTPEPEKPKAPGASKETVITALQDSQNLEDLEAKWKRASDIHGFGDDNEVHAAYTEMKESFQ